MKPFARNAAPAAFSALLGLTIYAVTLGGTYIYDDAFLIIRDPRVHQVRLWGQFWTHDWFNGGLDNLYRPLVSQSFGVQMWLHGDRPWAFHLVNVLLHAGACAVVAELGRRLLGWRAGLFAGLLFACHPIHSEAVTGIVGRAELACTLCVVTAMVLFLHRPLTNVRAFAIGIVSIAAMLSKEQGFLIPFLIAALIPIRRRLFEPEVDPKVREADRQALSLTVALLVWTAGGILMLREEVLKLRFEWERSFLNVSIQPMIASPRADRWLIPLALVGRYFQLLVAPVRLSIDYGLAVIRPTISRSDPYLWLGGAVVTAWIFGAVACIRRRWWIGLFCLFGMALTYSPAANIVMIATVFGERLMYLPSVFFLVLTSAAIVRMPGRWANLLLVSLVVAGSVRTYAYVSRWNDRESFYRYSMGVQPKSAALHLLLADIDYERGDLEEAKQIMDDSEAIEPGDWQSWKMSALIAEKAGDYAEAARDWKRAFDLYPTVELSQHWGQALSAARRRAAGNGAATRR